MGRRESWTLRQRTVWGKQIQPSRWAVAFLHYSRNLNTWKLEVGWTESKAARENKCVGEGVGFCSEGCGGASISWEDQEWNKYLGWVCRKMWEWLKARGSTCRRTPPEEPQGVGQQYITVTFNPWKKPSYSPQLTLWAHAAGEERGILSFYHRTCCKFIAESERGAFGSGWGPASS